MSLFGKILAVLNLLGAAGLIYLASVDYGARQSWALAALRHELPLSGLPVDATDPDRQGLPIAAEMSDETTKLLFDGVGGNPVPTQVAEVEKVKAAVNSLVQAQEANKRQQAFVLARILLPFADGLVERDEYLAARAHLATDAGLKALEGRYVTAFREARKPGAAGPDRSFEQAFRVAVRSQGGVPSEGLTSLVAAKLPKNAAGNADVPALVAAGLEEQRLGMVARLERLFAGALTTADQSLSAAPEAPRNSRESQREAIARLLIGLTPTLASAALEDPTHPERGKMGKASPGEVAWDAALVQTDEFKRRQRRVMVVSGIKTAMNAVASRASALRELAGQVDAAATDERTLFLSDDISILAASRDQADRVANEVRAARENATKLTTQEATVKQRAIAVQKAEDDLKESLDRTDRAIAYLRNETARARALRVEARDLLGTLAEREKTIRDLERQVTEAEKKDR